MLLTAADGGLDVETHEKGRLMLHSVIQLDGDIVTLVSADLSPKSKLAGHHFQRVQGRIRALTASVNRLLATLVALPTAVLIAVTLPAALEGEPAALVALATEILAAVGGIALPGPRKLLSRKLIGPAMKWVLRARGRDLFGAVMR